MAKKIVMDELQMWLEEAVRLRADMLTTEVRFFSYLVEGERVAPWKGKYTDFEQMLETTHLCAPHRYTAFRDALARVNGDIKANLETFGVDGVIEAGRIQEPAKRRAFTEEVVERAKQQACPLSPRSIKDLARRIDPPVRPVRGPADKTPEQLKAENEALRKENERLKRENERLRAELGKAKPVKGKTAA